MAAPEGGTARSGTVRGRRRQQRLDGGPDGVGLLAEALAALAVGDFSVRLPVRSDTDEAGESAAFAAFNAVAAANARMAAEIARVKRVVGRDGFVNERASLPAEDQAWRASVDAINDLIDDLVRPTNEFARVIDAVARGDLSEKMALRIDGRPVKGEFLRIRATVNTMVDRLSSFADEVTRVAREVGTEGKLGGQAEVKGVSGVWKDLTESVNSMASNLTDQVRNIAHVTTAVAMGDLSQKIAVDVKGEVAELKNTINTMVDQLSSFADEVTRVAREVGTEGKLGGQAQVRGVSGTWKDLTDNVNSMASNLTDQVRNIAEVTTAVARGDLSQKITADVKGEILELKDTINTMVDQLSSFADEVTRVAREVGTEGKLGGQAQVQGVSGTWKDLTDNVNSMASSLTGQVRAIADVSTAVTRGDLTRSITVEARGEVAELKNTINQMIENLRATTERNAEQGWLSSNLARFGGMMQGQRDLKTVSNLVMSELTPLVSAHCGAFFLRQPGDDGRGHVLELAASYGYRKRKGVPTAFDLGEGLVGQCALEKKPILVTDAPPGYVKVSSAVGDTDPASIVLLPVLFEDRILGVIEIASLRPFSEVHLMFLEQLAETMGIVINAIEANRRTEELLEQSQSLTHELQQRQLELQQTNAELADKAALLAEQNERIEVKNREIEMARLAIEEKAEQLALSSRYKSEFLANMSHELRTPLNSLLLLAKLLSENETGNLTGKQVEFTRTIFAAGKDLLSLIEDILDLSKIEAGKMDIYPAPVHLEDTVAYIDRAFRPLIEEKRLTFEISLASRLPATITTDEQRLQQVLRNLVANAVKFTESGGITLRISSPPPGIRFGSGALDEAGSVIAFSVIDTGIGIAEDRLEHIFEAFQQADGTTSRSFGGTGLGLSISREIAQLLGGELHVKSHVGSGSRFTLYLPDHIGLPPASPPAGERPVAAPQVVGSPSAGGPARAGGRPRGTAPVPAMPGADVPAVPPAPITGPGAPADGTFDGKTMLIVDDDVRNVFALASVLESRGISITYAENGEEAVQVLATDPRIDLVLMDVMMPGMDGYETIRAIRDNPDLRSVPIVAVTAKAMQGDRERAIGAGASDYLAKPVETDDLLSCLAAWLSHESGSRPARARSESI